MPLRLPWRRRRRFAPLITVALFVVVALLAWKAWA